MDQPNAVELERRYRGWETDRLLRALTEEAEQFTPDALMTMKRILEGRGVTASEIADQTTLAQSVHDERQKKLTGIQGFLLVFIVLFTIWSLQFMVEGVRVIGMVESGNILRLMGLTIGLLGVYGLYCSIQLIRKSPSAVWHTNVCMTLRFILWASSWVLQFTLFKTFVGGGFPLDWAANQLTLTRQS